MTSHIIQLQDVAIEIGGREVLRNVNLDIPQNALFGVIGPRGVGKSTLLSLISGMRRPSGGQVKVFGKPVDQIERKAMPDFRRKMGLVFQAGALFTHRTVYENVAFGLRAHYQLPEALIKDIVMLKLEAVGLRGTENLYPASLSGGMARRVALARALALDPQLMLYDEPITGLDPITVAVILRLIKSLHHTLNMTSVIISHQIEELASVCTHLCVLLNQTAFAVGSVDDILQSQDPLLQQFIRGESDGPVPFKYGPVAPLDRRFIMVSTWLQYIGEAVINRLTALGSASQFAGCLLGDSPKLWRYRVNLFQAWYTLG